MPVVVVAVEVEAATLVVARGFRFKRNPVTGMEAAPGEKVIWHQTVAGCCC